MAHAGGGLPGQAGPAGGRGALDCMSRECPGVYASPDIQALRSRLAAMEQTEKDRKASFEGLISQLKAANGKMPEATALVEQASGLARTDAEKATVQTWRDQVQSNLATVLEKNERDFMAKVQTLQADYLRLQKPASRQRGGTGQAGDVLRGRRQTADGPRQPAEDLRGPDRKSHRGDRRRRRDHEGRPDPDHPRQRGCPRPGTTGRFVHVGHRTGRGTREIPSAVPRQPHQPGLRPVAQASPPLEGAGRPGGADRAVAGRSPRFRQQDGRRPAGRDGKLRQDLRRVPARDPAGGLRQVRRLPARPRRRFRRTP